MVVAANNRGTCYVWRLKKGTQVASLKLFFSVTSDYLANQSEINYNYFFFLSDNDLLRTVAQVTST